MCGRYTLRTPPREWAALFGLDEVPDLEPRYNIAPTQDVATVRTRPGGEGRELAMLRWGLVPAWAERPDFDARTINARAETVDRLPSFRDAFRERRCLVVADGFYEWQPAGRRKQPYWVHRPDGGVFAMAGLWERWEGTGGPPLESCTIVTTDASERVRTLHDRMPVILTPAEGALWLDRRRDPADLRALLRPAPEDSLVFHPVSTAVNRPETDSPELIEPVEQGPPASQFRLDLS